MKVNECRQKIPSSNSIRKAGPARQRSTRSSSPSSESSHSLRSRPWARMWKRRWTHSRPSSGASLGACDQLFSKAKKRCHDERGAAMVEFALVLPLLLVLVFGMLEFGKAFNYWIDTTHLANEGARWAVVNQNPGTGTLQEYVKGRANTVELRDGGTASIPAGDEAEVCISFPNGTANVGDPV